MQRERELEERERHLLRLPAPLEQREQPPVVLDRLVERPRQACLVARAGEVRNRLHLVFGREPVVREQAEHLSLSPLVLALEPVGGGAVQRASSIGEQRAICGLLDQRVLEAVLGKRPAPGRSQEVESLELVERVFGSVSLDHCLEQREPELPPERGCGGQHVVVLGRKAVDAGEDDAFDGWRNLDGDVVVEPPQAIRANERVRIDERVDDLFQVERIAFGRFEHPLLEISGERSGSHDGVQKLALGVSRQAHERDLGKQVRHVAGCELPDPPGRMVALVPLGDDEQHGSALADRERGARRAGRRSRRPSGGPRGGSRAGGVRRASRGAPRRLRMCGIAAPPATGPRGDPLHPVPASVPAARRGTGRSRTRARRTDRRLTARSTYANAKLGIVHRRAEPLAQEVAERPVRQRLAVRDAATFEPEPVVRPTGFGQEAALADTGLAHDDEQAAASRLDPRERTRERRVSSRSRPTSGVSTPTTPRCLIASARAWTGRCATTGSAFP